MNEEEIFYDTPDGVTICGLIARHSGSKHDGNVVMTHGLNNDKDEDDSFVQLSSILNKKGYDTLRFDFRGHGDSGGKPQDVTVAGELVDLESSLQVFDNLSGERSKYVIVTSSFGAVAAIMYSSQNERRIEKLVLWNPVLDFERTFLKAVTPWGRTFFNPAGYEELRTEGYITIPETDFKIGHQMVDEFRKIRPYESLSRLTIPVLTIHGTQDTAVPFEVSERYGAPNNQSLFVAHDCEHTFVGIVNTVIAETVEWITTGKISHER